MRIKHGRVTLELHQFARREGPPLLLLHGLYGSSADWGEAPGSWPGAVWALDFAGHGRSESVAGGAYYPELLAGDADAALAHIGRAALAGAGVGAYVALLLAGARRDTVRAALLLPGAGLAGGGALPDFQRDFPHPVFATREPGLHDPLVSVLDRDVRPVDYAEAFARAARRLLLLEDGQSRPQWWEATRHGPTAETVTADLRTAFARLRIVTQYDD